MSSFERMEVEAAMSSLRAIQVVPNVQDRRRKESRLKDRILTAFRGMHPSERPMVAARVCRELLATETLAAVRREIVCGLEAGGLDASQVSGKTDSAPRGRRGVFGERA